MRFIMALFSAALITVVSTSAFANPTDAMTPTERMDYYSQGGSYVPSAVRHSGRRGSRVVEEGTVVGGRPAGCPRRYCGCGVSLKVFGKIIPELNLASNWLRKFPRTSAAAGMVAARSGHVFYIQSVNGDGTVVAFDPNSGGGFTRLHTVSLRGYRVVDPNGNRVASR